MKTQTVKSKTSNAGLSKKKDRKLFRFILCGFAIQVLLTQNISAQSEKNFNEERIDIDNDANYTGGILRLGAIKEQNDKWWLGMATWESDNNSKELETSCNGMLIRTWNSYNPIRLQASEIQFNNTTRFKNNGSGIVWGSSSWEKTYSRIMDDGNLRIQTDDNFYIQDTDGDGNNATTRFYINGSGNVGIGTTSLDAKLHVNGSFKVNGNINANDYELQNVKALQLKDWDDNTGGTGDKYRLLARDGAFQFYNGGVVVGNYNNGTWTDLPDGNLIVESKIGIATPSPKKTLHVNGDFYGRGHIFLYSYDGDGKDGTAFIQGRDDSGSSDISLQLRTQNNGSLVEGLKIDNLGNVGIGTTTPQTKLDVNGLIVAGGNSNALHNNSENGTTLNGNEGIILPGSTSQYNISVQDGNGRIQHKWNATTGTGEKFLVGGEDASFIDWTASVANSNWMEFKFADGTGKNAGDAISWETHLAISDQGNVGIGTTTVPTGYKMAVNGKIKTKGVIVDPSNWADYVFEPDYKLKSLKEVSSFIHTNGHLPDVPSAQEVEETGVDVSEMQSTLLRKIEELTLYILELNEEIETLKAQVKE